jgi:tRNA (guanine-N7-)-methyltransferase
MGKDKLKRFQENEGFECLFQPDFKDVFNNEYFIKGSWDTSYFKNGQPIVLELGCGRGEYTVSLAQTFKSKNFIGVDIKGARMWRGAKTVTENSITNAAFLRSRIEFINSVFAKDEVSEIWITFPDPQIKKSSKRLTSSYFLERYRKFLKDGGVIHLKTDSQFLHHYTKTLVEVNSLEVISCCDDIYGKKFADDILSIKTRYEQMFLSKGMPITYLSFKLDNKRALIEPDFDAEPYKMVTDSLFRG